MFKGMSLSQKIAFFIFMLMSFIVGSTLSYQHTVAREHLVQKAQYDGMSKVVNACYACAPACVPTPVPDSEE